MDVTIRLADLPEQHLDGADEGTKGKIVKWAPGTDENNPTLFKVECENGRVGGEDGCGIDVEEYEVRALMRPYVTRTRSRGGHLAGA